MGVSGCQDVFLLFNDAKDAYIEFIRVKVGKRESVCFV